MPYLSNAIIQVGVEEGYFADEGLAVETVALKSSGEQLSLLVTNELDVGTPALNAAFFNAVAQGSGLRVVLPLTEAIEQECASVAVLARQSDIDAGVYAQVSDWAGARIMASPAGLQGSIGYYLDRALQSAGLTRADAQIEPAEPPVYEEALRTGQADLVIALEPWLTRYAASEDVGVLLPLERFAPDLQASVIVYSANFLASGEAAESFARAYMLAVRRYLQGPTPENVEIVAAFTGLEADLVSRLCWSYTPPDGRINVETIAGFQSWLVEQGFLDAALPAEEYTDLRVAQHAVETLAGGTR